MTHIAFLGTGLLGSGMVENLLRRGNDVTVWNRTAAKARTLAELGARVAASPEDAVAGAARVHLALADDAAVDEVLAKIAPRLDRSTAVVDHSTTSPNQTGTRS